MAKYILKEVLTKKDEEQWIRMAIPLYRDYPNWVCPFDSDIRAVFDPKTNKFFAEGNAIRWTCIDTQTGKPAGRIAAFWAQSTSEANDQPTGGCGFFECINSQEVAFMLFDAAREWLKTQGMEAMDGPVNFGPRDSWWGVLVEGFEYEPLYRNPYNPPYYKDLFEAYGFQNYFNQNSYHWSFDEDIMDPRILERAERLMATPGYRISRLDMKNIEQQAEDLRLIYNRAWASFTGVKEMTSAEVQHMLGELRPIIDPNLIYFAYYNDEPIGFFIMVPDINCIIGKFKGRFGLINKIRFLIDLKLRKKCKRVFGLIFGIAPEYHGKGVESAIISYIRESYVHAQHDSVPYRDFEFAWIGDFNPVMNRMIQSYVLATRHKMHTTYRYLFDRTKEFHRCPRLGLKRPDTK